MSIMGLRDASASKNYAGESRHWSVSQGKMSENTFMLHVSITFFTLTNRGIGRVKMKNTKTQKYLQD